MKGLRINNKHSVESQEKVIDYKFGEMVEPIREAISGLYWVLSKVDFVYKSSDGAIFREYEDEYETCILKDNGETKLARMDFITDNAKFVNGDWDVLVGIADTELYENVATLHHRVLEQHAVIMFVCTDAAYWEIYSRNPEIIAAIRKHFPHSEECILNEQRWT